MQQLHIVAVHLGATRTKASRLPEIGDVIVATGLAQSKELALRVHLIDPTFSLLREKRVPEWLRDDDYTIKGYRTDIVEVFPGNYMQWLAIKQKEKTTFTERDRVIYVAFGDYTNNYEIMDAMEEGEFENRWYYIPSSDEAKGGRLKLETVVDNYPDGKQLTQLNNLYGGVEIVGSKPATDLLALRQYAMVGAVMLQHYLAAGFDKSEQKLNVQVPGWVVNAEVPPLKGLLSHYGIHAETPDQLPADRLLYSGEFRQRVTRTLAQALSNLAINNKLIGADRVVETGGWLARNTWQVLNTAFYEWDLTRFAEGKDDRLVARGTPKITDRALVETKVEATPIAGSGYGALPSSQISQYGALPIPGSVPKLAPLPLPGALGALP